MKRALAAILLCTTMLRPTPSHAVIPVLSEIEAAIAQNQLVQEIKGYVLETKQYLTDLQQLAQLEAQLQSFVQYPSLGRAMALMGQFGISDPFGGLPSFYAVASLTSGLSYGNNLQGIVSRISGLGSMIGNMANVNSVYVCKDDTMACQQQKQVARANAGYQGVLGKIYSEFQNHLGVSSELRNQLADASDPAQREHIMAALLAEQNWTTSALGQLQAANSLYAAQRNANTARSEERLDQYIDTMLAGAPQRGG